MSRATYVMESVIKGVFCGGGGENATVYLKTFSLDINHSCLGY